LSGPRRNGRGSRGNGVKKGLKGGSHFESAGKYVRDSRLSSHDTERSWRKEYFKERKKSVWEGRGGW